MAAAPFAIKPVIKPAAPAVTPAQATHAQIATAGAVNGAQEKNAFAFPLFGNEVRIFKQVIEHVGVEDGLAF